jgi:hypothetical protein
VADRQPLPRAALVGGGLLLVLALAVVLRGPVALMAVASAAAVIGLLLTVTPLLRDDHVDWDWQPLRADEIPPEPGVGRIRVMLLAGRDDAEAAARLQDLVRRLAEDRAGTASGRHTAGPGSAAGPTALDRYLAGPPRHLDPDALDGVLTDLEALTPRRTT